MPQEPRLLPDGISLVGNNLKRAFDVLSEFWIFDIPPALKGEDSPSGKAMPGLGALRPLIQGRFIGFRLRCLGNC